MGMKKLLTIVLTIFVLASSFVLNASAAPIGQKQNYKVTLKVTNQRNAGTINRSFGLTFTAQRVKLPTVICLKKSAAQILLQKEKQEVIPFPMRIWELFTQ